MTLAPKSCLWHAGDSPALLVRVEEGLLRAKVVLADGREYIKEFYWEEDEFLDFHHLLSGEPARYSVGGAGALPTAAFPAGGSAPTPLLAHLVSPSPLKCNCASRRRKSCCC